LPIWPARAIPDWQKELTTLRPPQNFTGHLQSGPPRVVPPGPLAMKQDVGPAGPPVAPSIPQHWRARCGDDGPEALSRRQTAARWQKNRMPALIGKVRTSGRLWGGFPTAPPSNGRIGRPAGN
jgi:hypothetical protein